MPEFLNPFTGVVPERKMTKEELVRALRQDLAAEHEAVHPTWPMPMPPITPSPGRCSPISRTRSGSMPGSSPGSSLF